jgi:hypothetical protein
MAVDRTLELLLSDRYEGSEAQFVIGVMDRCTVEEESGESPTMWHLCWQAAVGRVLFVDPALYRRVRERLIDAHRREGRVLVDYLLTPTEIHIVSLVPARDGPGGVARASGNVVARWVRQAQPIRSPVFAGPYRAHRIASADELRGEMRMLAWRPVFLGLCVTPTHYPHSSLRIALGMTRAQGFDASTLLHLFGTSVPLARIAMRAWVSRRPSQRDALQWELSRGLALTNGADGQQPASAREIRSAGAAALLAAGGRHGVDGALGLLEVWVAAKLGSSDGGDFQRETDATGARGRALVACLAVEHGLCSASEVARHFHRAKSTLSEQMTACKTRPADRRILDTPVQRIVEEALALRPGNPGRVQ